MNLYVKERKVFHYMKKAMIFALVLKQKTNIF